jgi:radical SAM superfamily enzyme YgiQ (UPF0313 family)
MLAIMYKAGCRTIYYGIESGNTDILKRYNKGLTLEQIENAVHLTRKNGINASGSFIIGGPGESSETIRQSLSFAKRIRLDSFIPIPYTPLPGSTDYVDISNHGKAELDYRNAVMHRVTFAPKGMTFNDVQKSHNQVILFWAIQPRILFKMFCFKGIKKTFSAGFSVICNTIKAYFNKDEK